MYELLNTNGYLNLGGGYLIVKTGRNYVIFKDNEQITKPMILRSLKRFFTDIAECNYDSNLDIWR